MQTLTACSVWVTAYACYCAAAITTIEGNALQRNGNERIVAYGVPRTATTLHAFTIRAFLLRRDGYLEKNARATGVASPCGKVPRVAPICYERGLLTEGVGPG